MNYYVYLNGQHVRSFPDAQAGRDWVHAQLKQFHQVGQGHGEYLLCYNGSKSELIQQWPSRTREQVLACRPVIIQPVRKADTFPADYDQSEGPAL